MTPKDEGHVETAHVHKEETEVSNTQARPAGRRRLSLAVSAVLLLVGLGGLGYWMVNRWTHVYVVDSRIAANVVVVSSEAAGRVTAVNVVAGDRVSAGDLLMHLETRQAELRLEEIDAEIARIDAEQDHLRAQQAKVRGEIASRLNAGNAEIKAAEAEHRAVETILEAADRDYRRASWLLSVFLVTLLSAFSSGQSSGWNSNTVLIEGAIAIAASVIFIWWERRTLKPMLDLALFSQRGFAAAAVVSFVLGAGLFGSTYLLPVFVQSIQGMTPTQAGLLLMPAGFALVLVFPVAGRLSDRLSPRVLIAFGMIVFAYSSYLGVNLLAVLVERRTMLHSEALAATQTPDNAATTTFLAQMASLTESAAIPDIQQIPTALWFLGRTVYLQASTMAYQDGFLITAVVFAAALVPTWLLHRER